MTTDLISDGTLEGLESARTRGRVGGQPAALSTLQALEARQMYDETDEHGKRRYTVVQIAEAFGVSRKLSAVTSTAQREPRACCTGRRRNGRGRGVLPAMALSAYHDPVDR